MLAVAGVLVLVAAAAFGARAYIYSNYWVGFDENDQVVVYKGLPGNIAGIQFARVVERTQATRSMVPQAFQARLEKGVRRESREDASTYAHCAPFLDTLAECQAKSLGGGVTPATTTTPSSTTTTTTSVPAPNRTTSTTVSR